MKQINLIPPDYTHLRYVKRRAVVWVELVLAAIAVLATLTLNLHGQLHKVQKEKQQLAQKAELHRQIVLQLNELAGRKTQLILRLTDIYAAQRKRVCSRILYDIAAAGNGKIFLTEFTLDSVTPRDGRKPSGSRASAGASAAEDEAASEGQRVLVLKGYALTNVDLTQFVSGLSGMSSLKAVKLRLWRQDVLDGLKLISFEIGCSPEQS